MATPLFIKRSDIVKNTALSGNVDPDKFLQFVKLAQEIHIQNFLGTDLYNKISNDILASELTGDYLTLINDYVQPMLIHYAMAEYGGVFKHSSENSTQPSKSEIDVLISKERDYAEYYTNRFVDYMSFNASSMFPEYYTNNNEDIYPDKESYYQGWVL